jgi:hypothetical protein
MRRELSPVESLAKLLCKALHERPAMTREELAQAVVQQSRLARSDRARRRLEEQVAEFEPALQLAVANGWLVAASGAFELTELGATCARRSRAGRRRARQLA